MSNSIDITPSPRILRMLGQIDFSAIQCLCELIDNSIDAFADSSQPSSSSPEIIVRVPNIKRLTETSEILISDNGAGMDIDQLNRSLKAGFSSNNPVDKMGLFGMGFNIATARLGQKTEIKTSKKEDDFFNVVTIDFGSLEGSGKFLVPIERQKKEADELGQHGTEIRISKLNPEHVKPLRQKQKISQSLGKTYGRILREKSIKLIYEGITCRPFKHCTWNDTRTGRNGTPAIIKIDHVIDEKRYCTSCWTWLFDTDVSCPSCNEVSSLTNRERRVKGWIGVQRFFDNGHYGFDLIRNGRVIKSFDKDLFYWKTEDDETVLEYPIDGFQSMGRFVGELEIDFVQVTHQKDAFEKNSTDWRDFVRVVRGDGPIQPNVARRHNFPENVSPLARLFSAFRGMKAGKINLVPARPGTNSALIRESIITDYRNKFFEHEHEHQDDEKWWELILRGEKQAEVTESEDDQSGGNPFDDDDDDEPIDDTTQSDDDEAGEIETIDAGLENDPALSGKYTIDLFPDTAVRVEAARANSGTHNNGFEVNIRGSLMTFNYWPDSKIFEETFLRPEDLLVNELAYFFFLTAEQRLEDTPLSLVERNIKKKFFPYLQPEFDQINDEISELTRELKRHLKKTVKLLNDFDANSLDSISISQIKKRMSHGELVSSEKMEEAINKGEFIGFADLSTLIQIFEKHPQTLFDGEFFARKISHATSLDEHEKELVRDALTIFSDVVWWLQNGTPDSSDVWKGRSRRVVGSLEVIRGWRQ